MKKKTSFLFLLALLCPVFSITADDAPGSPDPAPDPAPEPTPAPAPESADNRSVAAKFIDQLKSKDTLSSANAKLKTDLASANARITTLTAENTTLTGAVEASQDLLNRLGAVEKAMGLTSGLLSTGTTQEIDSAIAGKIASGVIDEQARAGVPSATLPAAAPSDVNPQDAKLNALTGLDRSQAAFASMPIFKRSA